MTNSRINLLILPLLVSILLSLASKLKIGPAINNIFFIALAPIHSPISSVKIEADKKMSFIYSLPVMEKRNHELTLLNAGLVSENEHLKQVIAEQKISTSIKTIYKETLPVRLAGSSGSFTVTSSSSLENVKPGQPLISGSLLLGVVSEVKGQIITITPLESEKITPINIRTISNQKGIYRYLARTPQITDIPSQNTIALGEYILTEASQQIPENLLLGKTKNILSSAQDPLQKAEISIEGNLSQNFDALFIVTKP